MRTLDPSLSPLPNTTSFGSNGTVFAQLFYAGVEQFYCQADSCTQTAGSAVTWDCQNLQCTCIPNTAFCGAVSTSNLTAVINQLSGNLQIGCESPDNSTGVATCSFKQSTLQSLFGSSGLSLTGCAFGECVRQTVIDNNGNVPVSATEGTEGGKSLGGGVIAGLAVVGGLVLLAIIFVVLGLIKQRKARRAGYGQLGGSRATVEWSGVSYIIAGSSGAGGALSSKSRKRFWTPSASNDDKVILDAVSGSVLPGQMMAILGPSGMLPFYHSDI